MSIIGEREISYLILFSLAFLLLISYQDSFAKDVAPRFYSQALSIISLDVIKGIFVGIVYFCFFGGEIYFCWKGLLLMGMLWLAC